MLNKITTSALLFCGSFYVGLSEDLPEHVNKYLSNYCLECHDSDTEKGDVNLDVLNNDWTSSASQDLWQDVLWMNEDNLMPPADKKQPTVEEKSRLMAWVKTKALKHLPIGGTLPRRLNQDEYENTIRSLFDNPTFKLPVGFPRDKVKHGFNNLGEGLRVSPPLLEAYSAVATELAEELFPRIEEKPKSIVNHAGPEDMVLSFSASSVRNGALRLASKSETTMRGTTWPSRIEIIHSGHYKIKIEASKFLPVTTEPMILEVRARELSMSDRTSVLKFRHLKDIEIHSGSPESTSFEADLYEGQTLLFRWKNAEMDHEYNALADLFLDRFKTEKRFHAAWLDVMYDENGKKKISHAILRGENGYNKVKARMADENLDLAPANPDSPQHKAFMKFARSMNATMSIADALAFDYFEHGPALEIHKVTVEGPTHLVEGPKDKRRQQVREHCFGKRLSEHTDLEYARHAIQHFTTKAFRRPVDDALVNAYLKKFRSNLKSGLTYDECFHLLIRNVLVSPRFLFRSLTPGLLDDYDLATRLSYFLTQGPPDAKLKSIAFNGKLSDPKVFKAEVTRLLPRKLNDKAVQKDKHHPMVDSFVSQWLNLNLLKEIMPAPEFNFSEKRMSWTRQESLFFFSAMLSENKPMTDFIDPNFTFTTPYFLKNHYKIKTKEKPKYKEQMMQRVSLERGGRHGGLLGQASVMIATANGVDTQPVFRGVWMMENILGQKVPPPPKSVPALTPDVKNATTPRELLAQHTSEPECMSCHVRMDPLGLMLENFDPVGKWRNDWPRSKKKIQSAVQLADGTKLENVVEFKVWLVKNIDTFTQCLSEKLLTYATGRELNYREKSEIAVLVKKNHAKGNKFKDLFYSLVESDVFKMK